MARHDVLIIGGGLIGCASAYYLARAGARVLVLDQGELNRGASGRNAGSLHFQIEHRLIRGGAARAAEVARIIPLTLAAIDDWRGLEGELGGPLEVVTAGGLMVAETAADLELLEIKQGLERERGLATSLLSASQVRTTAPYLSDRVRAAGFCPMEGRASPRLVPLAYARAARERGAEFRPHVRVSAILRDGQGWQVTTERGEDASAPSLLDAGGAWIGEIASRAGLSLPMLAMPLLMNVTTRVGPLVPHLIQHVGRDLSMKQVSDGNLLIGGGWPARLRRRDGRPDLDASPDILVDNLRGNLALALDLVPGLRHAHLLRSWTGIAGVTPDELPYLGEVPTAPGFYAAGGGSAFTLGPTLARLVAGKILGQPDPFDLSAFSPGRFDATEGGPA